MSSPREIVIEPITRLEGHGKIDIFLDEAGNVENTYMVIDRIAIGKMQY